jgi:MSHA biogenesis protein MshJ
MASLHQLSARLDSLSLRERVLLLVGLPVVLVMATESLVLSPARQRTVEAHKLIQLREAELKSLTELLSQQPLLAALPAADQLKRQRDELLAQIESTRTVLDGVRETVDWGTVVRSAVSGTPGLSLTLLKAQAPEEIFSSAKSAAQAAAVKPAGPAAPAASAPGPKGAAAAPALPELSIYRHRADLTLQGEFGALLAYLQALQRLPGALHWEKLQLTVSEYPRATVQLTLYTLSDRAQTPFN